MTVAAVNPPPADALAAASGSAADPAPALPQRPRTVGHALLYIASVPERLVRSAAGSVGMAALSVGRLLPRPIRESRFYRMAVVRQMRILTDAIGGARRFPAEKPMGAGAYARIGVGSALDNLAILTLHVSPLWILLAARDVADGARALVAEVISDLKEQGLVQPGSRLDSVDDLLGAVARLSERTSETLDCPPLTVADLKASLATITSEVMSTGRTALVDVAKLDRLADGVRGLAHQSGRSVFDVLTGLAAAAAGKGGKLVIGTGSAAVSSVRIVTRHVYENVVLDYQSLLDGLIEKGLWVSLGELISPHFSSTRSNLVPERVTWTEIALTLGRFRRAPWRET